MAALRVLLIDEEKEFVTSTVERLSIHDIYAEGALTGDQGLVKIKMHDYDVILMDVKMPGISGIPLVERIEEFRPEAKIILIQGVGMDAPGQEFFEHNVKTVFTKPVNFRMLVEAITETVESKSL